MSEEIKEILRLHSLWLERAEGGVRANLEDANLRGAYLEGAILRSAYLQDANLRGAYLEGAILRSAYLQDANLRGANLRGANLRGANLRSANLRDANLRGAYLRDANLEGANLEGANLWDANLEYVNLRDADLLCLGNKRNIKTMQVDTWQIGYTNDTLQIGCQRHPIDKWRRWNTEAGRKWIDQMDSKALAWADKHLALVLAMIAASPAEPTGYEEE